MRAGRGLVAVGLRQDGLTKPSTATLVWTSPDGVKWRRRPARELGARAFPGLLAARAGRVLLVGEARSSQPPPSTTTTPPTTVRTANGGSQGRFCLVSTGVTGAWTTTDASTWARSPAAPLDDVGVSQLVATHGRWLVGGYRGDGASPALILYASADGRHWHETIADPDDVNAVNPQTRMPLALAATPTGAIVAVTPFGDLAGGPDVWIWSAPAKR